MTNDFDMSFEDEQRWLGERVDAALQAFGKIQNIGDELEVPYDPYGLTHQLQATCLTYFVNTPEDSEGYQKWLVVNKSRQSGISTTISNAAYVKAQYTPGWEHITSADKKERADYLFQRVSYLHNRWPDDLKVPMASQGQLRAFYWDNDSKMIVRSGGGGGMGIGASASSWHWSEVPLWPDAATQWSYAAPALMNRKKALMVFESTPFPLHEPSANFFMELCETARAGKGRFVYAFEPYWDSKLNARKWPVGSTMSNEEIRLLETYGRYGLRKENLAFRREVMEVDSEVRRNPDLFRIFYPFDDLTCWMSKGSGVINSRHLERHLQGLVDFPHDRGYIEYQNPKKGANYVIGVDPAGYGARDHASFQVFEVWAGSWRQVAVYAAHTDPPEFTRFLDRVGRKFNNAMVCVERNGVGVGVLTLLEEFEYPNLYYETNDKPGIHKRSEAQLLSGLIDALNETFVLRDRDTVAQLRQYRSDRSLERTVEAEILHVGKKAGRRDRHHWDKVSALMYVPPAAMAQPQRVAPDEVVDVSLSIPTREMTVSDYKRYEERIRNFEQKQRRKRKLTGGRNSYRSVRRKGIKR